MHRPNLPLLCNYTLSHPDYQLLALVVNQVMLDSLQKTLVYFDVALN